MSETPRDANYPLNILVVDDDIHLRKLLGACLTGMGHRVVAVSNSADAVAESTRKSFDLAYVDLRLGKETGLDLIPLLHVNSPWMKVVIMTATATIDSAVQSIKLGSIDYLPKPFTVGEVKRMTERIGETTRLEQNVRSLQEKLGDSRPEVDWNLTSSPSMQRAIHLAKQVAQTDATVLIRGEFGTGKGLLARAIHGWSNRASKPFGTVSCSAISEEHVEEEMFGLSKPDTQGGASVLTSSGNIAMCEGGTLYLDDVGGMPLAVQPKLRKLVQDHEYERAGEQQVRQGNVRVIAATHEDLELAVKEGRFREDLYYQLNVIQIEMPPLRERSEDIVPIAERMLAFFARRRAQRILGFTPEAMERLKRYSWPGNLRELQNVIERCAILSTGEWVEAELLPGAGADSKEAGVTDSAPGSMITLAALEELHIRRVLASVKTLDEAANVLGIDSATLWRRRKAYGI